MFTYRKERPTRCVKALGGEQCRESEPSLDCVTIEAQICFANSPRALCAHDFSRRSSAPIRKTYALRRSFLLEQVTGIEPAYSAWEADTLPLSYTCASLAESPFIIIQNAPIVKTMGAFFVLFFRLFLRKNLVFLPKNHENSRI